MISKNLDSLPESKDLHALIAAIFFFCESVSNSTKSIHTTFVLNKAEIRDQNKKTIFSSENKALVKRLYNFPKLTSGYSQEEKALFVSKGVINVVKKEDYLEMLDSLMKKIKQKHPKPWVISSNQNCIVDKLGKTFLSIPNNSLAISHKHLKDLINFGEPSFKQVS